MPQRHNKDDYYILDDYRAEGYGCRHNKQGGSAVSESKPEVIVRDTKAMDFEEVRRGRVHMIRRKRLPLETGVEGVTMEYSLSVVPDGYFTPRHRHNFDQIRYTLSGVQSTGLGEIGRAHV